RFLRLCAWLPTSFLRHVGETPLSRHRFCAMSGKRLCPDIVFAPCRGNASVPTSFLRHVGETPLSRHRFCAMSANRVGPDIVVAPCRGNASVPTSFLRHVGETPLSRHRFCTMSVLPCHGGQTTAREAVISNQSRKNKNCRAFARQSINFIHLLKSCGCC